MNFFGGKVKLTPGVLPILLTRDLAPKKLKLRVDISTFDNT